jgi:hypothetical protein
MFLKLNAKCDTSRKGIVCRFSSIRSLDPSTCRNEQHVVPHPDEPHALHGYHFATRPLVPDRTWIQLRVSASVTTFGSDMAENCGSYAYEANELWDAAQLARRKSSSHDKKFCGAMNGTALESQDRARLFMGRLANTLCDQR